MSDPWKPSVLPSRIPPLPQRDHNLVERPKFIEDMLRAFLQLQSTSLMAQSHTNMVILKYSTSYYDSPCHPFII